MDLLRIGAEPGLVVEVSPVGATLHAVWATAPDGSRRNLVLGFPSDEERIASSTYAGSVVGRVANRIAGSSFELDGRTVEVGANEGRTCLHGGPDGFDRRRWQVQEHDEQHLVLQLVSADGDQGFPGELVVSASYAVDGDVLTLDLEATTDAPTVVGLTSHAYWNLDGSATIDGHRLRVDADRYLPVDDLLVPTGEVREVHGDLDLRAEETIGGREVDHCYVLSGGASLEAGGIRVELTTDQPGLQVYTGDQWSGAPRCGIALEPEGFPDAVHHADFPSPVLRPGETCRCTLSWSVSRTS